MNYYPQGNNIGNYPNPYQGNFNGNTGNQMIPQQMIHQPYNSPQQYQMQQPQMLNGKIVDSVDIVKVTEVPVGSYGVFPKADLSEVYIKSWNGNGTTSITTYQMVPAQNPNASSEQENTYKAILERMGSIEEKLDDFLTTPSTTGKEN